MSLFGDRLSATILAAAPDGIMAVDKQGKICLVNPALEHMLGYDVDELLGISVEALVPLRLRDVHSSRREQYEHALERRPMGSGLSLFALRKDGGEVPVEISLSPLPPGSRSAAGSEPVVVAVVRDVSEQHRLLESVRASESVAREATAAEIRVNAQARLLHDELIATVRHEVASPLSVVLGRAQRGLRTPDLDRASAHEILREVLEQARLIERLLKNLDQGAPGLLHGVDIQFETVVVQKLLEECVVSTGALTGRADDLELCVSGDPGEVEADPQRVKQVVTNLIGNAAKFSERGRPICVTVEHDDAEVRIRISDRGIGINRDDVQRLFKPFSRLHAEFAGTGLGLAISAAIVEAHDGRIWVESDGDAHGTCVSFSLPRHPPTPTDAPPSDPERPVPLPPGPGDHRYSSPSPRKAIASQARADERPSRPPWGRSLA